MPENRSDNQGLSLHREERARSISRGFVTAVGFSVLFVCVLGIFASVFYTSFKARNSLEKKADEYIDSLGENLEIPLWSLNEPVIRRIGKSFVHNDLVTRVKIMDTWNHVLFLEESDEKAVIRRKADILHNGTPAGHVEIALNMRHFELIKEDFLLAGGIMLILSMGLLLILLSLFLRHFFHTPLQKLGTVVEQYAAGNYEPPQAHLPYVEFQPIADLLERMGFTIDSQMKRLNRELSERKEAETALIESEKKYRELVEKINDVIYTTDENGRIEYISPVAERMTGFSPDDMTGKAFSEFLHPDDRPRIQKLFENAFPENERPFECRMMTNEGGFVWIRCNSLPVYENNRLVGRRGMFSDISKEKLLEERLRHAQKAEALGTLTGGIAHDFNNILGIILGYAEIARSDTSPSDPVHESLEQIRSAGLRAKDIVKQLLTFTRKEVEPEDRVTDIRPVVKEALEMLRSTIPASIEFQSSIPDELPLVGLNSTRIHQILVNLCTNAAHAMEDKGVIRIRLESVYLDAKAAAFDQDLAPGNYVRLSVRDTGHGIEPENLQRIFDPYFTTKDVDKGSGLGLSTILGIVKGRNGGIRVSSRPGEGTEFEIFLPAQADSRKLEQPESDREMIRGTERILLVDDEEMLAETGHRILEGLGYRVTSTTDPQEALEWVENYPARYDLVITDMTMPGVTGDVLARKARSIRSDLPVILCTGHNAKISKSSAAKIGLAAYLEKPVNMKELAGAVRKALDTQTRTTV